MQTPPVHARVIKRNLLERAVEEYKRSNGDTPIPKSYLVGLVVDQLPEPHFERAFHVGLSEAELVLRSLGYERVQEQYVHPTPQVR